MADGDLPKLGGRAKDIARAQKAAMKPLQVTGRTATRRLGGLVAAEEAATQAGKRGLIKAIGLRLGSRVMPAATIALTAYEVYQAGKEGINAYRAYKDLERTREYLEKRYGNEQRAKATRLALTRRRNR